MAYITENHNGMSLPNALKKDRYPGIRSFEAEDERLFYGRTNEIDDLFSLVMIKSLVVLFGKSGLGKSSLLKAGLGSVLLKNHFFPIMIRVQDTNVSPIETVLSELNPFGDQKKLAQFGGKSTNQIWETINACNFKDSNGNPATPVLIFDQFEELFNHEKSIQSQWAAQLSDLIEGRRPKDIDEALQQIPRRERTPEQLEWFEPPAITILFAIRSDRMSELHQLRYQMPAILQNRFELKPLQSAASSEAIEKPAALIGAEFTTQPFTYAPETVQEIQNNLSNEAGEIESFQLQIVCQHVEEKVKAEQSEGKENIIATADFLGGQGGIQHILKNYYDNHIRNLGSEENQLAARKLLEEGLIADGRRIGVADAVVKGTFGIDDDLLGKLLESRLIRPENTRLGRTFEISHDTLVAPILEAYEKRRLEEERITKQKELEERERQLAIERRKRRISTMITIGAVVLSLLAISTSIFAWNKSIEAEAQKEKADSSNALSQKIIDAFYFYGDSLALASKKEFGEYGWIKYGFINKEGETIINYQYDGAIPFDRNTGFAWVTKNEEKYLLGPDKVEYPLANSIKNLTSEITALDLRDQSFTHIPDTVFQFPKLKIILFDGNPLTELPPDIGKLMNLQTLNLRGTQLTELPSNIDKLVNLQSLDLFHTQLTKLPSDIGKLVNLQTLNLSWNTELASLPSEIGKLVNLHTLNLSDNQLTELPSNIGNLVNLQSLDLSMTYLTELPSNIGKLVNLRSLDLTNNADMTSLPSEIGKLVNLQTLFLNEIPLAEFPSELGNLVKLQLLNLSTTNLTEFPSEIGKLVNLQSLDLSYNDMTSLPPEIGNLVNLKEFYLTGNSLTKLPSELGNLLNLQTLYLGGNELTSLPSELGNMVNLRTLDLYGNDLSEEEMQKIKKLLPNCNIIFE